MPKPTGFSSGFGPGFGVGYYHYGFTQYEWVVEGDYGYWRLPSSVIGAVDLRPIANQAQAGGTPSGFAFVASLQPVNVLVSRSLHFGEEDATTSMRDAWESELGYRPQGPKVVDLLWDYLTNGSDPEGIDGPKPLMAGVDQMLKLFVGGHSLVKSQRFNLLDNTPHADRVRTLLQKDYGRIHSQSGEHSFRVLDYWCEKYRLDKQDKRQWEHIIPASMRRDARLLPHQTTISDAFTGTDDTPIADHTPTDGGGWVWNPVANPGGPFEIHTNQLASGGSSTAVYCRAERDLSSEDHYVEADIISMSNSTARYNGVAGRCLVDGTVRTMYISRVRSFEGDFGLFKEVNGTLTQLDVASDAVLLPDRIRLEMDGSTISGEWNSIVLSVTDTSITGNLRTGIRRSQSTGSNNTRSDNFEAADLDAGGGGSVLVADPGSYAITGTDASLEQGYEIPAESGSFSFSGAEANLKQGYEIAADAGEYLLVGTEPNLEQSLLLTGDVGIYSITGVEANLERGRVINPEEGSYLIDGAEATLVFGDVLGAEPGEYTLSGVDASLEQSSLLLSDLGTYSVTGVAANLEQGYLLQVGNPNSTGPNFGTGSNDNSTGTHAWGTPEDIGADDGTYAEITTMASAINSQWLKSLNPGFNLPSDVHIEGIEVTVDVTIAPNGTSPTIFLRLVEGGVISGEEKTGAFTVGATTYGSPTDLWGLSLSPADINNLDFGAVIRLTAGSHFVNDAHVDYITLTVYYRENVGVYSLTGTDATFSAGAELSAEVGSYLITGVSASLLKHSILNAAVGVYTITGVAANLAENLENIIGGRFVAGQVYYPGFVNAEIFYPGFKQGQVNN